ncbi:MAG: hypothetical protein LBV00_12435, partial [Propionibacteriaceae bacterium]|nr:hypothetical protein [Propionibacteriaceae bacterium]
AFVTRPPGPQVHARHSMAFFRNVVGVSGAGVMRARSRRRSAASVPPFHVRHGTRDADADGPLLVPLACVQMAQRPQD